MQSKLSLFPGAFAEARLSSARAAHEQLAALMSSIAHFTDRARWLVAACKILVEENLSHCVLSILKYHFLHTSCLHTS